MHGFGAVLLTAHVDLSPACMMKYIEIAAKATKPMASFHMMLSR